MDFVYCALTCAVLLCGADCDKPCDLGGAPRVPYGPLQRRHLFEVLNAPTHDHAGYLCRAQCGPCGAIQWHLEPYCPRAGDLIFFDSEQKFWDVMYFLARTDMPDHMSIMVCKSDGCLSGLESGPDNVPWVFLLDPYARLHQVKGSVKVRKIKRPLTPEESARLTEWAEAQVGKRYPFWRLVMQLSPCRAKGPMREHCFGKTDLDRRGYLCAEICVAAGVAAGIMDPCYLKANAIYPYDIVDNHRYDLSYLWEDPVDWRRMPLDPICCTPNAGARGNRR